MSRFPCKRILRSVVEKKLLKWYQSGRLQGWRQRRWEETRENHEEGCSSHWLEEPTHLWEFLKSCSLLLSENRWPNTFWTIKNDNDGWWRGVMGRLIIGRMTPPWSCTFGWWSGLWLYLNKENPKKLKCLVRKDESRSDFVIGDQAWLGRKKDWQWKLVAASTRSEKAVERQ